MASMAHQIGDGTLRCPDLRTVGIEYIDELVILLEDLGPESGQHTGTHRVAADVQNAPNIPVFRMVRTSAGSAGTSASEQACEEQISRIPASSSKAFRSRDRK